MRGSISVRCHNKDKKRKNMMIKLAVFALANLATFTHAQTVFVEEYFVSDDCSGSDPHLRYSDAMIPLNECMKGVPGTSVMHQVSLDGKNFVKTRFNESEDCLGLAPSTSIESMECRAGTFIIDGQTFKSTRGTTRDVPESELVFLASAEGLKPCSTENVGENIRMIMETADRYGFRHSSDDECFGFFDLRNTVPGALTNENSRMKVFQGAETCSAEDATGIQYASCLTYTTSRGNKEGTVVVASYAEVKNAFPEPAVDRIEVMFEQYFVEEDCTGESFVRDDADSLYPLDECVRDGKRGSSIQQLSHDGKYVLTTFFNESSQCLGIAPVANHEVSSCSNFGNTVTSAPHSEYRSKRWVSRLVPKSNLLYLAIKEDVTCGSDAVQNIQASFQSEKLSATSSFRLAVDQDCFGGSINLTEFESAAVALENDRFKIYEKAETCDVDNATNVVTTSCVGFFERNANLNAIVGSYNEYQSALDPPLNQDMVPILLEHLFVDSDCEGESFVRFTDDEVYPLGMCLRIGNTKSTIQRLSDGGSTVLTQYFDSSAQCDGLAEFTRTQNYGCSNQDSYIGSSPHKDYRSKRFTKVMVPKSELMFLVTAQQVTLCDTSNSVIQNLEAVLQATIVRGGMRMNANNKCFDSITNTSAGDGSIRLQNGRIKFFTDDDNCSEESATSVQTMTCLSIKENDQNSTAITGTFAEYQAALRNLNDDGNITPSTAPSTITSSILVIAATIIMHAIIY